MNLIAAQALCVSYGAVRLVGPGDVNRTPQRADIATSHMACEAFLLVEPWEVCIALGMWPSL